MSNKKFILFWLLSLFIIAIIFIIKLLIQNYSFDTERIIWTTKKDWIENNNLGQLDYIIVGSSKTLAINPDLIYKKTKLKGENLSVPGATILFHYYAIKRILKNHKKIKKIYINLIPYQLDYENMSNIMLYNQKLVRWFLTETEAKEINKYIPDFLLKYKEIKKFYYQLYTFDTLLKHGFIDIKNYFKSGVTATDLLRTELNKSKGFYLFGGSNPIYSNTSTKSVKKYKDLNSNLNNLHPSSIIYFNKLIKLLNESKIDYTFFFSPYYIEQSNYENLNFQNSMNLFSKLDNDKINNSVLLLDKNNFVDASHLNFNASFLYNEFFINNVMKNNQSSNINIYKLGIIND